MYTALIVENDKIQREGIRNILSEAFPQIQFALASDYKTAIKYINKERFHLFLLDIRLGDSLLDDGIRLGRYIRQQEGCAHTPILYITSITDRVIEALNETHCYSYLTKPFPPKQLIDAVGQILQSPLIAPVLLKLQDTNGVFLKVNIPDIYYLKSEYHRLLICTPPERTPQGAAP